LLTHSHIVSSGDTWCSDDGKREVARFSVAFFWGKIICRAMRPARKTEEKMMRSSGWEKLRPVLFTIENVAVARSRRDTIDRAGREEYLIRKVAPRKVNVRLIIINTMTGHRVKYGKR
jgi:hypothetical protein